MKEKVDVKKFSDIKYSVNELEEVIMDDKKTLRYEFEPLDGKIIVSTMFRLKACGRGKNIIHLLSESEEDVISIWCEGMGIYSYEGEEKRHLGRYHDNEWVSVWVSIDITSQTYDVCLDGRRCITGARIMSRVKNVSILESYSRLGKYSLKHIFVYRNPIQSVNDLAELQNIYDAMEMGIQPNGCIPVTKELQYLIDTCSLSGGGVVYLKGGIYYSGTIILKKNTSLYIESGATLKGVKGIENYPLCQVENTLNRNMTIQGPQRSLIFAEDVDGLIIAGGGIIDGSGDFEGDYGSESNRPCGILLVHCNGVKILDICVMDIGMWGIPIVECDNAYIRDLNIYSYWFPNRDGIDICDCHNVLVEHSFITADDDAVCLKSGEPRGCKNVFIRNMMIISVMANAVKFGTFSVGGFFDCVVCDCVIKDSRYSAIAIESVNGGHIKNLSFENIYISDSGAAFFIVLGNRENIETDIRRKIGSIEDILFKDVVVENMRENWGNYLCGHKEGEKIYPLKNIVFNNVKANYKGGISKIPPHPIEYDTRYPECNMFGVLPCSAYFMRHIEGLAFVNCEVNVDGQDNRDKIGTFNIV